MVNRKIVKNKNISKNFEGGFTLLEVMVAVVILGLGLTLVFELFAGGLRSVEISSNYSNAVILANKKMGELSMREVLKTGKEMGDFPDEENYKWEVEVFPYQIEGDTDEKSEEAQQNTESPVKVYQINLRVFWKSGLAEKDVKLTSIRTFMEKPPDEEKK